jgi:hypothetical protein
MNLISMSLVYLIGLIPTLAASAEIDAESAWGDSTCWFGPVPEGLDPCGLLEQAQGILVRLPGPVEDHVQELAMRLDIERSLRVQQGLLREHLAWLDDGLTTRQLDLVVFVAVALSLDRAQGRTVELHSALEKKPDPKLERSLQNVELYRSQALSLLDKLSPSLKDISDEELRIRF